MTDLNKYTVISIADFEATIRGGNRYEGLVNGIGYVYWENHEIYFIQTNQNKPFEYPVYQQIKNPWFGFDRTKKVHTKTLYTLCVLSRQDLMKYNRDMYGFYYRPIIETEKAMKAFVRDATRVERPIILADIPHKQSYETNIVAAKRVWGVFDTATDVADELGLLSKPVSKYLSIGKTVVNVVDNVSNGKYIDAAGNVIMSCVDCSIGLYIDAGVAIYKTDYMQRQIARAATKEYLNLQNRLKNLTYGSSEYNKVREKIKIQGDIIKQCTDNLGIKYDTSTKPQWKQGY